ncbi:MAG: DUF1080 domain-containing protein [Akkermansiaceae bacterium]
MIKFTRSISAIITALCLTAIYFPNLATGEEKQAPIQKDTAGQWTPLFNGKDLTGWKNPYKHGTAVVVDGEIHLTANRKFFLTTEKTYSDFELKVEIQLPEVGPANSGVMLRCHVQPNKVFGYQAECDPTKRAWTGRIYDEGRRKWKLFEKAQKVETSKVQAPLGKWIKYRILAVGDHLQVWVDGALTTDLRDAEDASGHIGIQHHGEKGKTYRFRNISIREIKAAAK